MNRHAWPLFLLPALVACGSDFVVTENQGHLIVSPTLVDLDTVLVGTETPFLLNLLATDSIVKVVAVDVRNVEGQAFSMVSTEMPEVEMDGQATLDFLYLPTEVGYHWAEITIQTDEQEDSSHLVRVRGSAADPMGVVTPTLIDFGPVDVGEQATATVSIENTSLVVLSLAGATSTNPLFTTDAYATELDPGTNVIFNVTFTPTDRTEATGQISFDAGERVTLDPLSLRGNACSTASGDLYDQDEDGVGWCGGDCDDEDRTVLPGADETCDGKDNDCDGGLDEGTECADDDLDGYSENDLDCNDADPLVYPGAIEIPDNGIDDNCDGFTDLGAADNDVDGYAAAGGDCDDFDANTHPGAEELPDLADNDCDGLIDEDTINSDDDLDGYTETDGDCNDLDANISPGATEIPNWKDDDCDGLIDDDTSNADDDADGYSERGGDCDDTDATISPAAIDVAGDGIDSDCDGSDE